MRSNPSDFLPFFFHAYKKAFKIRLFLILDRNTCSTNTCHTLQYTTICCRKMPIDAACYHRFSDFLFHFFFHTKKDRQCSLTDGIALSKSEYRDHYNIKKRPPIIKAV